MHPQDEVLRKAYSVATNVAVKAGTHILQYWPYQLNTQFNSSLVNEVYEKEGIGNVATLADKQSEEMIISAIKSEELLKQHTIVGEESDAEVTGSDYAWHIDPIDGTSVFRNGLPEFGICIGLLYKNEPILGVIARPALGEYIAAQKDKGAKLFSFTHEEVAVLSNKTHPKETSPARLLIGYDTSTPNRLTYLQDISRILNNVNNMITYGSTSATLFRLALGQIGSYIHVAPHTWDIAAAAAIIPEIGGIVSAPDGSPIDWSKDQPPVLASYSPEIHQTLLSLYNK